MANKVYWITLATVLNGAKRYIQRNFSFNVAVRAMNDVI